MEEVREAVVVVELVEPVVMVVEFAELVVVVELVESVVVMEEDMKVVVEVVVIGGSLDGVVIGSENKND